MDWHKLGSTYVGKRNRGMNEAWKKINEIYFSSMRCFY